MLKRKSSPVTYLQTQTLISKIFYENICKYIFGKDVLTHGSNHSIRWIMGGKETNVVSLYHCGIRVNNCFQGIFKMKLANEKERREKTDRGKILRQESNNEEGNQPPQKRSRVISEEKVISCDDSGNSNEDDFSNWERYSDFSSSDSVSDDSDW